MKKLVLASAMSLLTLAAQAQTITSDIVLKTYTAAVQNTNSEYTYNADIENGIVTAQYIYKKELQNHDLQACETIKPHMKHQYEYDGEGRLTHRTTSFWNATRNCWQNSYRLNYTYGPGLSIVECSRWNERKGQFLAANERTVYELQPGSLEGIVSKYQRKKETANFVLTATLTVPTNYFYGDHLTTTPTHGTLTQKP